MKIKMLSHQVISGSQCNHKHKSKCQDWNESVGLAYKMAIHVPKYPYINTSVIIEMKPKYKITSVKIIFLWWETFIIQTDPTR